MTLIARTTNHRAPTMLADILMSSKKVDSPFILPAIGTDISMYLRRNKLQPAGLAQKIYILNDHICLALAGREDEMKVILEELSIFCSIAGVTNQQVKLKLDQLDYRELSQSAFFLMVIEAKDDGYVQVAEFYHGQFGVEDNILFDQTQATGSGTADFLYITKEKIDFTSSFEDEDPRQAIVKNISLIARLLARERYTIGPVLNGWGGGYEFVFYNGKRFEKFGDVAYVLQTGEFSEVGSVGIELPIMVLYFAYYDEHLIITTVQLNSLQISAENEVVSLLSNEVKTTIYPVHSLKRGAQVNSSLLVPKSFETYRVAMGFAIKTPIAPLFDPCFFSNTMALKVAYFHEEGALRIEYKENLQAFIAEKFERAYQFYKKQPDPSDK